MAQLSTYDPKDGCFYILTFDKGDDKEYRTRFMTYSETLDLIFTALKRKDLGFNHQDEIEFFS